MSDFQRDPTKPREDIQTWDERITLPKEETWFVIELWIDRSWFRLQQKLLKLEDAQRSTTYYNFPTPYRIVELRTVETEVWRADKKTAA